MMKMKQVKNLSIALADGRLEALIIPVSDETTNLTTGTAKITFRMPYDFVLSEVRASVNTAPVGSTIIVDINAGGVSILSPKITIDASEKTSVTAAVPPTISDPELSDDVEITIDIDQIGSGTAGKGLKVVLIGNRVFVEPVEVDLSRFLVNVSPTPGAYVYQYDTNTESFDPVFDFGNSPVLTTNVPFQPGVVMDGAGTIALIFGDTTPYIGTCDIQAETFDDVAEYPTQFFSNAVTYPVMDNDGTQVAFITSNNLGVQYLNVYETAGWTLDIDSQLLTGLNVNYTAFSFDGTKLALSVNDTLSNYTTRIYETTGWTQEEADIYGDDFYAIDLHWSSDGTRLYAAGLNDNGAGAGEIRVMNTSGWTPVSLTGTDLGNLVIDSNFGLSVALSNDGTMLAVLNVDVNEDAIIHLFDTSDFSLISSSTPQNRNSIAFYTGRFNNSGTVLMVGHEEAPYVNVFSIPDFNVLDATDVSGQALITLSTTS